MTKFKKMINVCFVVILITVVCGVFAPIGAQDGNKKINVNTASAEELTEIKGIGQVTARKIVDYRKENGSFSAAEDLTKVKGIGSKTVADIEDRLVFESGSD
ncbi:MAG: ComEA family DNA-binding protein [Desulfobacterales bacterium]